MSSTVAGLIQVGVLVLLLAVVYVPLGNYMARVYSDDKHWGAERVLYRIFRVNPDSEQRWSVYAGALLAFSFVSILFLYLLQRLQGVLPLSLGRGPVEEGIAFNTAVSFVTNTNWQSYVPETTMGHLVQMAGLTVQNFVSAAVGMAVAVALIRGFARTGSDRIGNLWVDLTRGVTRILLPIAFVGAIVLLALGVTQSLAAGFDFTNVDGNQYTAAVGPFASQEVIKELGTNGGGSFNANSSHPFENPNGFTNLLENFLLLVIPVCFTRTFGKMIGDVRQGHVLVAVMTTLWALLLAAAWLFETNPNGPAHILAGGAMEGKETRFGIPTTILWAISTTGTSTGAVNGWHDAFSGGAGGMTILNMLFGEVAPGGVGAGLYGILVLAIIAVFLAGLMVGRTPEYLGKKLGRVQVTAAAIAILAMPTMVLLGSGAALAQPAELDAALTNSGAHGMSEILYAYASAANNNGSAFAGLTVTSPFFQSTLGIAMLIGRFVPILAVLALAGSLAAQKRVEPGAGSLPTSGPLFGVLLGGTVVLVAALTFFPALALGPFAEALA